MKWCLVWRVLGMLTPAEFEIRHQPLAQHEKSSFETPPDHCINLPVGANGAGVRRGGRSADGARTHTQRGLQLIKELKRQQ